MAVAEAAKYRMAAAGTSSPRQVVRAEPASGPICSPRAADGPYRNFLRLLPPSPSSANKHVRAHSCILPRKAVATNAAELRVRNCPPSWGSPPLSRGASGSRRRGGCWEGKAGGERRPPGAPAAPAVAGARRNGARSSAAAGFYSRERSRWRSSHGTPRRHVLCR